jgi:hypothetical protein
MNEWKQFLNHWSMNNYSGTSVVERLISNKSVPEHKTKTKNPPVPEQANWQPGT